MGILSGAVHLTVDVRQTRRSPAISFIALGHGPELMTEGKLEDEWRWRMLAALQTGCPIILFDNLKEKLESGTVSAIVTRPDTYSGRMVGSGKSVTVPIRVLWLLTANNMKLSRDNAAPQRAHPPRCQPGAS